MSSSSVGQSGPPHSESFLRSLVWHDTRMDIIHDVLAHPTHTPSLPELEYANTFTPAEEIRFHATMLVEYSILTRIYYDEDDTPEGAPRTFYTLSDGGWATIRLFNGQFTPDAYERLTEAYKLIAAAAPPEIQRCRDAPRPRANIRWW